MKEEASVEKLVAGLEKGATKPVVRRKGISFLEINDVWSAADSLFRAEEHIERVEDNVFHWKWAIICLQNSLYTFALKFAAGTNPYFVMTKEGRAVSFVTALSKCCEGGHYHESAPFAPTRGQKNSVLWLHDHLRNNFEHFQPQKTWGIGLPGLPNICVDVLEVIRFLALDGGGILYHAKSKKDNIERSIKRSIEMLKSSRFCSDGDVGEHPRLAVNRTLFSVAYGGPTRLDSEKEVITAAFVIKALTELFEAANGSLNGKDIEVALKREDVKPGSLKVSLEMTRISNGRPVEFLLGGEAADARRLRKLVLGEEGILWLIKKLEGRVPDKMEKICRIQGPELVTVGDESFEVCAELSKLYRDVEVRVALEYLIDKFLKLEHIENFEARCEDGPPEPSESAQTVSKSESEYFSLAKGPSGETTLEPVRQTLLRIVSPSFEGNAKWRFRDVRDGDTLIKAAVADRDFLRRVDSNEVSFAKGDVLACRVKTVRKRAAGKHEYIVESVADIVPATRQPQQPL